MSRPAPSVRDTRALTDRLRATERNAALVVTTMASTLTFMRDEGENLDEYVITRALDAALDLAERTVMELADLTGEMPRLLGEWHEGMLDQDFARAAQEWAAQSQKFDRRLKTVQAARARKRVGA